MQHVQAIADAGFIIGYTIIDVFFGPVLFIVPLLREAASLFVIKFLGVVMSSPWCTILFTIDLFITRFLTYLLVLLLLITTNTEMAIWIQGSLNWLDKDGLFWRICFPDGCSSHLS